MSTNDDASSIPKPKLFSSQEFMEFLAKQVDISKLTVVTKSGDKISASFNGIVSPSGDESSIFKSLDALKSLNSDDSDPSKGGPPQSTVSLEYKKDASSVSNDFTSKDWQIDYEKNHVDVTYAKCFSAAASGKPAHISSNSTLPPKKRAGKTDWYGMYASALSPLVEAASLARPQPVEENETGKQAFDPQKQAAKEAWASTKQSKRKPRKVIPTIKDYVEEYRDQDILFGRGGRSNHHPGNKVYREFVTEKQTYYRSCDKNEKTKVAQSIVDAVQQDHKGRFLELDKSSPPRWFVVPNIVARRKVGQALRENNTEQARAAKREKYGQVKL